MDNTQTNSYSNDDPMIGKLIFDRYKLIKRLGSGSFGSIYSAEYDNQYFAIKLEEKNRGQNLLENEAYIMSYLGGPGLPIVKSYGYSCKHNILIMELMGKSLEDIFESFVVKKMSPRCVCNIGYQMIELLEYIHNKHVIHRDIKPDNFVIGLNVKKKYIYILDFGLSKKYRSSKTLKHYPIVKNKNLTGTARYASINALNGWTQSRRDDLEAIGYVLMYFLRGKLPWQGIPAKTKEDRYRKIMLKKKETSAEELCMGFPNEFAKYVNYTRSLQYEEDPKYYYLKDLFTQVLSRDGFRIDCFYDWDNETIFYFRDFRNVDSSDNNKINKSKTDSSTLSTNQQYNNRDINSHISKGDNRFNYNKVNYLYNNSNINTNTVTNTGNNNRIGVNIPVNRYEESKVNDKSKEPESLYANEIVKEYINNEQKIKNNKLNQNNLYKDINHNNNLSTNLLNNYQKNTNNNNNINTNLSNNYQNNNNNNNNNNNKNNNTTNNTNNNNSYILGQNQQTNKRDEFNKENKKDNNEQNKCYNPRQEKDNKCCLIF